MKKIVICDDVEIDRSILRHFLEKYFDDRGEEALVEEYSSGESLTADVEEKDIWEWIFCSWIFL